jgi:hypothetical protein
MELGWAQGRGKRLDDYQADFPELFRDPESLEQIAYEEYRVRRRTGERPTHIEYRDRYGVRTFDWPIETAPPDESVERPSLTRSHERRCECHAGTSRGAGRDRCEPAALQELSGRAEVRADAPSGLTTDDSLREFPDVGSEFGGFRLLQELGSGAFARVYLARQRELAGRLVVLKITTEITSESQALSRLQHTHVVPIYSVHRCGPFRAICMPYFGSTTLADVLRVLKTHESLPSSARELLSTVEDRRAAARKRTVSQPPECRDDASADQPARQAPEIIESPVASQPAEVFEVFQRLSYVEGVLWMAARLADGLNHAHERGIVHRDLKVRSPTSPRRSTAVRRTPASTS